jgi:hypothetical protein
MFTLHSHPWACLQLILSQRTFAQEMTRLTYIREGKDELTLSLCAINLVFGYEDLWGSGSARGLLLISFFDL